MTTVLLAHGDPEVLEALVPTLSDRGLHVLGPARTAATALTLAAIAPASFALVGERLAGRRDGRELKAALEELWGIRAELIDENGWVLEEAP